MDVSVPASSNMESSAPTQFTVPRYLLATPIVDVEGETAEIFATPEGMGGSPKEASALPFSTYFGSGLNGVKTTASAVDGQHGSTSSLNRSVPLAFAFAPETVVENHVEKNKARTLCPLPMYWNNRDKCSLLEIHRNGCKVVYVGSGKSDADAAAVRANARMPPQAGIYYYEVKIVSKGRDGYIGIGFCGQTVSVSRLPGWEQNSWGYHGDDGHSFACSGTGKPYGPSFTTGDIVGCGVDFANRCAFYTKNGIHLGVAFRDLKTSLALYPSVGLRTPGEAVEANFGRTPFVFDIEQHFDEQRNRLWNSINLKSLEPPVCLEKLILDYLKHHSYVETAKKFARECGSFGLSEASKEIEFTRVNLEETCAELDSIGVSSLSTDDSRKTDAPDAPDEMNGTSGSNELNAVKAVLNNSSISSAEIDFMAERRQLTQYVEEGDIPAALRLIDELAPELPNAYPHLIFALKNVQYTQLVVRWSKAKLASGSETPETSQLLTEIVQFGQSLLADFGNTECETLNNELGDLFSLLAYADPEKSPVACLLDPSRRHWLAQDLNSAVLACKGEPAVSRLSHIYRQASAVKLEMVRAGIGSASLLNLKKDIVSRSLSSNCLANCDLSKLAAGNFASPAGCEHETSNGDSLYLNHHDLPQSFESKIANDEDMEYE